MGVIDDWGKSEFQKNLDLEKKEAVELAKIKSKESMDRIRKNVLKECKAVFLKPSDFLINKNIVRYADYKYWVQISKKEYYEAEEKTDDIRKLDDIFINKELLKEKIKKELKEIPKDIEQKESEIIEMYRAGKVYMCNKILEILEE